MENNQLFLRESDSKLVYRGNLRVLKYISIKRNKVIELIGNRVLTEETIKEIETIILIKGGEVHAIPIKKRSGIFKQTHNVHKKNKLETVARFEVASTVRLTEGQLKRGYDQSISHVISSHNMLENLNREVGNTQ